RLALELALAVAGVDVRRGLRRVASQAVPARAAPFEVAEHVAARRARVDAETRGRAIRAEGVVEGHPGPLVRRRRDRETQGDRGLRRAAVHRRDAALGLPPAR